MSALERLLYLLGIPEDRAELLYEHGIFSLEALLFYSPLEISRILNISLEEAKRVLHEAFKMTPFKLITLRDFLKEAKEKRFTTGCKSLDSLLGGGIPLGSITEFVGEFGTGKTQICHQLCITIQLSRDKGGLGLKALYIDSTGSFRPERLIQIARRFNLDEAMSLKGIFHIRVHTFAQQYAAILRSSNLISRGLGLIILDSISSPLRSEYASDIVKRRWALSRLLHELRIIAKKDIAIVMTNDVITDPYTGISRPVGASILNEAIDMRVFLYKEKNDEYVAELTYSLDLPRKRVKFRISSFGIMDVN